MVKSLAKRLLHNFIINWQTILQFEIIYKLLSIAIIYPLFWLGLTGIMKVTGNSYITSDNFFSFLLNPMTMILLVVLFVFMAVYVMIDISAVIFIYDQSEQGHKVGLRQTFAFALKNAARAFHYKNILITLVVLFMIPFLNVGVAFSFVGTIRLPDLWQNYVESHLWVSLLVGAGIVLMIYFLLHWLYAFHYFTLEHFHYRMARGQSRRLSRDHEWAGLLALAICQGVFYLLYLLVSHIGVWFIVIINKGISGGTITSAVMFSAIAVFLGGVMVVLVSFAVPLSYLVISCLFYHYKEQKGEVVVHSKTREYAFSPRINKYVHRMGALATIAAVVICSVYTYGLAHGKFSFQIESVSKTEVTAHRGYSASYPENTMAAFVGAKEQGADWIELDVQECADGEIIVFHDEDFSRICDDNHAVWELTYDEIEELDAGSYFSEEYEGESIPLLSEVLAYAKLTDMNLNIELKPHGHGDDDLEEKVVALVKKYHMKGNCVLSALDYGCLEEVKSIDENMKTAYILTIAYGDLSEYEAADAFSIEASVVTKKLVHSIHEDGKEVYAWTVNAEDRMEEMVEYGVDNLITDDVLSAKAFIMDYRSSAGFSGFVRSLLR